MAALACAAMLLPATANPFSSAGNALGAASVAVTKAAPATATVGELFDYTISLQYVGALTTTSPPINVTDALPPQVVFRGWAITGGVCPSVPPQGQGGTVQCTVQFAPGVRTITLRITAQPVATGTATNVVQLSTGESANATTTIGPAVGPPPGSATPQPAPPGSVTATMSGPETLTIDSRVAPARFPYTVTLTYVGPPLTGAGVTTTWAVRLPVQIRSPGFEAVSGNSYDCVAPPAGGSPPEVFSCTTNFKEGQRTTSFLLSARPTGATGIATAVLEVATGATASWTTTITRAQAPTSPVTAPAPLAGPAAAPVKTVVETFTQRGEAEAQSVSIAPSANTTQVALTWPDADSAFDATGFRIVRSGQTVARAPSSVTAKVRPRKLLVSKRRTARSLDVRIKGLTPGRLVFKIVAKRLPGRTRVVVKVRQSKRG